MPTVTPSLLLVEKNERSSAPPLLHIVLQNPAFTAPAMTLYGHIRLWKQVC